MGSKRTRRVYTQARGNRDHRQEGVLLEGTSSEQVYTYEDDLSTALDVLKGKETLSRPGSNALSSLGMDAEPCQRPYDGSGDPERPYLKLFQSCKKLREMGQKANICATMFNSTLTGNAKVWLDKLPKESIDSYEDLRASHFRGEKLSQQNKSHIKGSSSGDTSHPSKDNLVILLLYYSSFPSMLSLLRDFLYNAVINHKICNDIFLDAYFDGLNILVKPSQNSWYIKK
ncbi:hypothetical protein Tco_0241574 [Tanacetum coccineum]